MAALSPDLVVMDCMSYTRANKARVRQSYGGPVILAIAAAARAVEELVALNEPALTEITLEDIKSLAVGALILGTGGGDSPYWAYSTCAGSRGRLSRPVDLTAGS